VNLTRLGTDERRAHHRYTAPSLETRISGAELATRDWSLGGMLLNGVPREAQGLGADREIIGRIELGKGLGAIEFTGRIVRADLDRGEMAVAFTKLSEQQLDQFARLFKTFRLTRSVI